MAASKQTASSAGERNWLLRSLGPREYASLRPHFELVTLASGEVLYEPNAPIEHVYFPQTAVASMVRRMTDGAGVEVGTIGREGLVGVSVVLGATSMPTECFIQISGVARRMTTAALLASLTRPVNKGGTGKLPDLLRRYAQALFEQVAQSAACNRLHSLEQRCARWILMTHDRVEGDELALTQLFLSYMLGVRRAGVTEVCGLLQSAGLIRYHHGQITITDRAGLERICCECFRIGVTAYESLLGRHSDGKGSVR